MLNLSIRASFRWNNASARVSRGLVLWVTLSAGQPALILGQTVAPAPQIEISPGLPRALSVISAARMLDDVTRFSHAEFNGRQAGTNDDRRTALLVATTFHALGLRPAGSEPLGPDAEPWAQTTAVSAVQIGENPVLELSEGSPAGPARLGTDYLPILDSPSVNATARLVFVGYGISDPARGFDEYEGIEVRNRIVLFMRGKPERYGPPVTQADKERTARERGAVGFLSFTGPVLSGYEARRGVGPEPVASYTMPNSGGRPLPGCSISTQLAERLLSAEGRSLREWQATVGGTMKPQSFPTTALVHMAWESLSQPGALYNVLGLLPGGSGDEAGETIVIGAHRDHFGRQAGLLFPGADDNASGTAVLLEAARALAHTGTLPRRTILFVSFSGEEQNLVGSRLYVGWPARPLRTTMAMLNVDHAGIGNGRLLVGVAGTSKAVAAEAGALAGMGDLLDVFGFFPGGDHVPFKEAGVPTFTVVSAGAHPQFHRPSDQAGTIRPEILETAARYVVSLAWLLANAP